MVRNEMLNSFAQLETIKNSVISGIPASILSRKISDIKREYFPEEFLEESFKYKNENFKIENKNENESPDKNSNQVVVCVEKPNNNDMNVFNYISDKDFSFSRIKENANIGDNLNIAGNVSDNEASKNNKEKEIGILDSASKQVILQQIKNSQAKITRSNLKSKNSSKKSLSDGEIQIEKADNINNLKEKNNITFKKNLNNLSNLKNKQINNLTKAPDNPTGLNYLSDNNLNKDYKRISKNVIDATPTFTRNSKAEQNNKAKENSNKKKHPVVNNNIAKRYHSPSPVISKIKKVNKANKDQYKTPDKGNK